MATLVQIPNTQFQIDDLCNITYPNIVLIKTLTNKSLVCRLDFNKITVNKIIENLIKKIGYNIKNYNLENISFIHKGKKWINKDKTLKDLGCSDNLAELNMFYDSSGRVRTQNSEINEKALFKKIENAKYTLSVKTLTGKTIRLKYTNELQIIELKYLIFNKVGMPVDQQRLISKAIQLKDDDTLSEYKIKNGDAIHLVSRLRGGMFHETSGKNGNYKSLECMIIDIDYEDIGENVS